MKSTLRHIRPYPHNVYGRGLGAFGSHTLQRKHHLALANLHHVPPGQFLDLRYRDELLGRVELPRDAHHLPRSPGLLRGRFGLRWPVVRRVADLLPRAITHHRWYLKNLAEYPTNRKAVFPGLL